MSYTKEERNNAILRIRHGQPDLTNVSLYEDLERHNWINLCRLDRNINAADLTYSGKDLFRALHKILYRG